MSAYTIAKWARSGRCLRDRAVCCQAGRRRLQPYSTAGWGMAA